MVACNHTKNNNILFCIELNNEGKERKKIQKLFLQTHKHEQKCKRKACCGLVGLKKEQGWIFFSSYFFLLSVDVPHWERD